MDNSNNQKHVSEKIERYRQRLSEQEPLKAAYHDHKENIMIAILGFLLAINIFLFDNAQNITDRGPEFVFIALVGFIAIYTLGLVVLKRQFVMKRGAAAHSAAINSDLWAIATGTFDPDTIGMPSKQLQEINLQEGISDSRFVSMHWSSSYLETFRDAFHKNVFKDFDFKTLLFAGALGLLNILFFAYGAYAQDIFSQILNDITMSVCP